MSGKRFLRASLAVMAMVTPPVWKWYRISYRVCAMRAREAEAHAPRARKLHARGPGQVAGLLIERHASSQQQVPGGRVLRSRVLVRDTGPLGLLRTSRPTAHRRSCSPSVGA